MKQKSEEPMISAPDGGNHEIRGDTSSLSPPRGNARNRPGSGWVQTGIGLLVYPDNDVRQSSSSPSAETVSVNELLLCLDKLWLKSRCGGSTYTNVSLVLRHGTLNQRSPPNPPPLSLVPHNVSGPVRPRIAGPKQTHNLISRGSRVEL